ncbi:hypothetical protein C8039_12280 [Halogeometricum sp. wsp3]|nr:hypothetical protein C8039_12280 [Halogeometricum sp. wsp3]
MGSETAVCNLAEQLTSVTDLNSLLQVVPELNGIALEVQRCFLCIRCVDFVIDSRAIFGLVVMEVCDRMKVDRCLLDLDIEVSKEIRVGPRLVARVRCLPDTTTDVRFYDTVFSTDSLGVFPFPLFQLHHDDIRVTVFVPPEI